MRGHGLHRHQWRICFNGARVEIGPDVADIGREGVRVAQVIVVGFNRVVGIHGSVGVDVVAVAV